MKYIRTKDGVFEITRQNDSCVMVKGKYLKEECKLKRKEDKQADTIEELCDEFVIVNNADRLPFRLSVSVAKELEEKDKTGNELYQGTTELLFDLAKNKLKNLKEFVGDKEHHDEYANYLYENNPNFVFEGTIKGAIWTDKGLIYVAKMNDKGELELL